MKLHRIIMLALLTVFSLSSYAATASEELKNLLNSVKTMQAAFTQTIYDNRNKAVETSHGKMSLERPGKFRWEVSKPIPQLIIANQNKLWIYDPDLEQVTIRKLDKVANDSPALLLSHVDTELDKSYIVKSAPDEENLHWFVLVPKNSEAMFEQIKMGFDKQQVKQMQLADHLGHTTSVKFSDIKTNNALSASLFNFTAPKNTDVIDETKK